ncbi:hypothetical protein O7623_18725 [Solwaraspora sp. WMMD791]|uniref:hypothetical protein n=1 Tax=Solwaraspora sp. WMMD791 TaxID=3016086 RepID=UPI00249C7C46|nr:hypothetical protein [Solwaraspora sp. WMMD791]WFE25420.1 hypothetical protein O7623_18725 [Solwaraspora sp. WMMD791]
MPSEPLIKVGDVLRLRAEDWAFGNGPVAMRISHLRHGHDVPQVTMIAVMGTFVAGPRTGQMMLLSVFKHALRRPGVVERDGRPVITTEQ